jgi:2-C-methyl-D-erythritol 4-phosphate cytidylyltransferase
MSAPSLKVVVAITSPIAFHTLNNQSVVRTCLQTSLAFVAQYGPAAHLAIAGSAEDLEKLSDIDCEKLICDASDAHQLALALQSAAPSELVMIHDSQRPLTAMAQFDRVLAGLTAQIHAVRPVAPFTETLKSVTADGFVAGTIDRSSMMRVSTPELIRYSAIDFNASSSTWFVPLMMEAKIATVSADLESARINTGNDLELMQLLSQSK